MTGNKEVVGNNWTTGQHSCGNKNSHALVMDAYNSSLKAESELVAQLECHRGHLVLL